MSELFLTIQLQVNFSRIIRSNFFPSIIQESRKNGLSENEQNKEEFVKRFLDQEQKDLTSKLEEIEKLQKELKHEQFKHENKVMHAKSELNSLLEQISTGIDSTLLKQEIQTIQVTLFCFLFISNLFRNQFFF